MAKPAVKETARPAISQNKLRSLLNSARSAQKDINEISGTLGERIKTAVENDYLNRKAFNVVKMADRMEPEKLAVFLEDLEHYLEISGLNKRAADAPRMAFEPAEGDGEGDGEGEDRPRRRGRPPSNVSAFPAVAAE